MFRRRALPVGLMVLAVTLLGGGVYWRFNGPVLVNVASTVKDLPFEVEVTPAWVWVRPGDMIEVIYRVRNNDILPTEVFGRVDIEPGPASDQVQVFLTQCSGLNTIENKAPQDYLVLFRVKPAGWLGYQYLTLRHTFVRVVTRE
jgi:hypothetical protein